MAQSDNIANVIARAKRSCERICLREAERSAAGLPRNAIIRDAHFSQTAQWLRRWRPLGWYSTHCAHDKVFWERCAMCRRTTQADIALATKCMWEVLTLAKARVERESANKV